MPTPCRNPTVFFCPGDKGLLAYDTARDRLHRMNATASLIAELCDGERTIDEIQRLVMPLLPQNGGEDVRRCIRQGLDSGIFETDTHTEPAAGEGPNPAGLARQLKNDGKFEVAYVCQYNATEREPDNPEHWAFLGELGRVIGRRADARAAYERYLDMRPEDAEIRHLLVALRDEVPPPRAADTAVEQLYARFASFYESNMLDALDYQAPARVSELVADLMQDRDGLAALDLGCGSGLAGVELRSRCAHLVGVDLSTQMLDLARERAVYDALEVAEINGWLRHCEDSFDLIIACDSLIYFGDLRPVISAAAPLLRPGGFLIFTLERGGQAPFHLSDSGRYTHDPDWVRELAAAAGLEVCRLDEGYLRMEYGEEVTGLFVALGRERTQVPEAQTEPGSPTS